MAHSDSIAKLAEALAKAQGKMTNAVQDRENPGFHFSYATLASVWDAARGPLSENGLSVAQVTRLDGDAICLETILMHSSGEWISSEYPLRPVKQDPQGYGSALTYARRYTFSAIIGVTSDDDDDGNAASGNKAATTSKATSKPQNIQPAKMPVAQPQHDAEWQKVESLPSPVDGKTGGSSPHWIDDGETRDRFFRWVGQNGLDHDAACDILHVEHLHDYAGSKKDAMDTILAFLKRRHEAATTPAAQPQ